MDVRDLHADFLDYYGEAENRRADDAVKRLIQTILSQNVADENTSQALDDLFAEYPDYKRIENAPTEDVADAIAVAGLQNQKARRIQRSLRKIREQTGGEYNLSFLDEMDTADAQAWLEDINGIGPKTASIVLNFQFDKPTFAVDTHVERLSKRFGLIPEDVSNEQAHVLLNGIVPDDIKYGLHVLMIQHGKEHCTALSPDCDNPICETYCDCEHC